MAMTSARRSSYRRGWYERECRIDKRRRRREYNKRIRRAADPKAAKYSFHWKTMS